MSNDIHTCSYSCDRPECIKAQRDELAKRFERESVEPVLASDERSLRHIGDEVHNASCAIIHVNEEIGDHLGSLACELWGWGKVPTPAPAIEWSPTLLGGSRVSRKKAEAAVAAMGDGWRLPTLEELQSIVDRSRCAPAINIEQFPGTECQPYWTSTKCAWSDKSRWVVDFYDGSVLNDYDSHGACVRACRASQKEHVK